METLTVTLLGAWSWSGLLRGQSSQWVVRSSAVTHSCLSAQPGHEQQAGAGPISPGIDVNILVRISDSFE